jgi:hypothetical protein
MSRHKHDHKVDIEKSKPNKPIAKAFIHNVPLPEANALWLHKDIKPRHTPCGIRVTVAVTKPGEFDIVYTHHGDSQVVALNQGTPLTEESIYSFEFMVHHGDRINFRYSTTLGTIKILRAQEIDSSSAIGRVSYQ